MDSPDVRNNGANKDVSGRSCEELTKQICFNFLVRVTRKWNALFGEKNRAVKSIEMIFLDEKGTTIQATIPIRLSHRFNTIEEGSIYVVNHLEVKENDGKYRITAHPYRFELTVFTKMQHREQKQHPSFVTRFKFASFADIQKMQNCESPFLIDVIGAYDLGQEFKKQKTQRDAWYTDFHLANVEGQTILCTLYGELVLEVERFLATSFSGPVISIIQACHTNKRYGEKIGVASSWDATKLILNEHIPAIEDFRCRFLNSRQTMKSIGSEATSSCVTLRDDSIDVGFTMPLFDLDSAKEVKGCWFYAEICSILSLKNWAYLGCSTKSCLKKLKYEGASLYCHSCKDVKQTGIWRYMLKLMVKHGQHFAEVVIWDDVSNKLIGKPADDLSDSLNMETLSPSDVHNDVLDLIGRELIFKVGNRKVNTLTNEKEYTIVAFSENADKIKELKDVVQEEVVEVYNSDSDLDLLCDEDTNVESNMTPSSQEIESHHTPESVLSKRHVTDENESDEMEQSSAKKKLKGVKIEM